MTWTVGGGDLFKKKRAPCGVSNNWISFALKMWAESKLLLSKHTHTHKKLTQHKKRWNCHPAWNFWSCYHKFWPNKWHSSVPKTNKVEAVGPCPYVELLYSVLAACYAFPYLNHSMKRKCVKTNTSCTLQQKMALNIFVWVACGRAILRFKVL